MTTSSCTPKKPSEQAPNPVHTNVPLALPDPRRLCTSLTIPQLHVSSRVTACFMAFPPHLLLHLWESSYCISRVRCCLIIVSAQRLVKAVKSLHSYGSGMQPKPADHHSHNLSPGQQLLHRQQRHLSSVQPTATMPNSRCSS